MQTDEVHWVLRAELLQKRVKRLSRNFSTHLGHPGVFPAFVLMSGQVLANKLKKVESLVTRQHSPPSPLLGARLGNALFSSLLPCIVFLFLLKWTRTGEAFCIGALLALGPRMVDLSQIAHVDTILTVIVTLTVFTYLTALRTQRVGLKLITGALFGLCLLSKPTCLALIPAFVLTKEVLHLRWPQTFKEGPVTWSDVWVLVTALVVFVLSYTRMWHHLKSYPQWEGIDRTVPDYLYSVGFHLSSGTIGVVTVTTLILSALYLGKKILSNAKLSWVDQALALTGVVSTFWIIMPQAFENLALYFMRVFALTSVQHVSFRGVTPPIPGGYITLATVDLPPLVLISLLLTPALLFRAVRRTLSASEQQVWVMAALVSVVWILFLSTSSKQAWRYALPVAPQLYIIASFSLCAIGRAIKTPKLPLILILLGQVKAVYRAYPHWDLYQSPFAPPPQVAAQLGLFHPRTGQREAIDFLLSEARKRGGQIHVTVFGDGKILSREAARWLGKDSRLINFGYFRENKAEFMLVQGATKVNDDRFSRYLSEEPIFVSQIKRIPVARIYKVAGERSQDEPPLSDSPHQLTSLDTTPASDQDSQEDTIH